MLSMQYGKISSKEIESSKTKKEAACARMKTPNCMQVCVGVSRARGLQ